MEVYLHAFLTSTTDRGEFSASRLSRLNRQEIALCPSGGFDGGGGQEEPFTLVGTQTQIFWWSNWQLSHCTLYAYSRKAARACKHYHNTFYAGDL
jgi:hypothetical protein